MLSATGITQVLAEETASSAALEDEPTQLQAGATLLGEADVKQRAGAETELMESPGGYEEFDLDLNDLEAALSDAETVEQPRSVDAVDLGFTTSSEATPIDLEIGEEFIGADDPTGTEDVRAADPQTLTEVGTKLDLARAYIDMGDPDGARSILEEVLSEGDSSQRDEAQSLIEAIGA
jgi:pilus assembly protein FimV